MNTPTLIKPLKTIILIDDNFIDNYVHHKLLESMNIANKYMEFTDPLGAINYLKIVNGLFDKTGENSIDLIILDANISKMNIWEFIELFRSLCIGYEMHTKIIIVSDTLIERDNEQRNSEKLVSGFIRKPLTRDNILNCFKSISAFQHFSD